MAESKIEQRVETLENQVKNLIATLQAQAKGGAPANWRKSLGMFDNHPLMKAIDNEGQRIREADRAVESNDRS